MPGIYDYPEYYDIAASWELEQDIAVLRKIIETHAIYPVRHILEPACGTGRYLMALAELGYRMTGYDANSRMIAFAQQRIEAQALTETINVTAGDMIVWKQENTQFDAACNLVGSLGYLLKDQDILAHLQHTGAMLRKGGSYVVQLTCAWDGPLQSEEAWQFQQGNVQVATGWRIIKEDRRAKRSQHLAIMTVQDGEQQHTITDVQELRLWEYQDLQRLIQQSGVFTLDAIYSREGSPIPLDSHINGEMGPLYYVLQVNTRIRD